MSGIDDRIVKMDFQNSVFERGVATTLGSLDRLKKALSFSGQDKGLNDVQAAANKFSLGNVAGSVEGISKKFLALSTIGITALANITNKAIDTGVRVTKSLTIDPIAAGFKNYETQINAIQTILANTGLKGSKGLGQVNDALNQLNTYANQTVYNFSEMTRNIGTFTAAGVDLKTSTASIKGIANLAALSGSTSEQASQAMYQLSQAIAANKVGLQDWNSVVNAGLGGKVFQQALFNTGKALHTIKGVNMNTTFDQWTKAGNSFRGSLQSGWITGKVLTQTLEGFTGDLTDAQLKSMGYNAQQIKQIREMGKTAVGAATKIKTLTQLSESLKEEVATAYGAVFKTIFGDINQSTKLFSAAHVVMENALTGPIYSLNKLLQGWAKLGGRNVAIESIKQAFKDLNAVIKPIKEAFREIFPRKTAQDLYNITVAVKNFLEELQITGKTSSNIKRTFAGLFAIFDIARQIMRGFLGVFVSLAGTLLDSTGSITAFTANIGDFLVALDKSLKKGGQLNAFFDKLTQILAVPLSILIAVGKAIFGLFDGFNEKDAAGISDSVDRIGQRLDAVNSAMSRVVDIFQKVKAKIQPGIDAIENAFNTIGEAISNAFSHAKFSGILDTFNTGFLAALVILVRKFMKNGLKLDFSGGLIDTIKESFEGLTGTMKAMQTQLKANTLEKIAIAVGILTASVVALSLIDSEKLTKALTAMSVGFGELLAAMGLLTKISGSAGFVKVPVIASSMILLSTAMLILTVALRNISNLNWTQLGKGLGGLAGTLLILSAAVKPLSANSAGMIRVGIGLNGIAVALNILYLAVLAFSKLSWKDLIHGLAGVAGVLTAVALGIKLMPKGMVATGAGLVEISIALNALYLAVKQFSSLNWTQMGKGLAGIGAGLVVIAGAMHLMPKGMVAQAAALDLVALALLGIGRAVGSMGSLSWAQIGKGLGTMAAALVILAGSLHLMQGTLPGSAALAVSAGAVVLLTNAAQKMGNMSWKQIAKGLTVFAGALGVLVLAGLGAEAVVPGLIALGIAALGLGAGLSLAGFGIGALASGLSELADTGSKGIAVLLDAFTKFVAQIPSIATALAVGFINVLKVIGDNGPAITKAFIVILGSVLTAITVNIPQIGALMSELVQTMLGVLAANGPKIIAAGLNLLVELLTGIADHMDQITTQVSNIIINFLNALAKKMPGITAAGANMLVQFLFGIARNLGRVVDAAGSIITSFVGAIGRNAGRVATAGANAIINFVTGLGRNASRIVTAGADAIISFVNALGQNTQRVIRAGAQAIVDFLNGLQQGIREFEPQIIGAMLGLGGAMIQGILDGLGDIAGKLAHKITGGVGGAIDKVKHVLGIGGPSKLFADEIGVSIPLGMAMGVDDEADRVTKSVAGLVDGVIENLQKTLAKVPDAVNGIIELKPTITPVVNLSKVQQAGSKINSILAPGIVNPSISTRQALLASATISPHVQLPIDKAGSATVDSRTFEFNQYNNSPKALSALEIYRGTKSQIAQAKEALGLS